MPRALFYCCPYLCRYTSKNFIQVLLTFLALAIFILNFAGFSSTGKRARVFFKIYFQNARWQVYVALEILIVLVGLVHFFINVNRGRRYWSLMYAGFAVSFVSPLILWETLSVEMYDRYQLFRVSHLYMTLLILGLVLYSLGIAFLEGPFEKVSKWASYLVKRHAHENFFLHTSLYHHHYSLACLIQV